MPQEAILSCESCTRRKIKCDKQLPTCSNCDRFGIKCNPVSRQRLPRGRNGGRKKADDSELRTRLARLESMVKSMEAAGINPNDPSTFHSPNGPVQVQAPPNWTTFPNAASSPANTSNSSPSLSDPGAGKTSSLPRPDKKSFWATFEDEVVGLREILEREYSDEEGEDPLEGALDVAPIKASTVTSNLMMLQPGTFVAEPSILQQPPDNMITALCDIYLDRVDVLFKLLHAPSLRKHLQDGELYLGTMSANEPSVKALRFAIFYAAVNSLQDTECMQFFFQDRTTMMTRLRASVEVALAQADVVCARSLETLQAFSIYLAAVRLNDSRPTTWTLVALAIRLARGMGLHQESSLKRFNTFHAEMRRRTWYSLCLLDTMTGKDRGSEPLFATSHFDTKFPVLLNDTDIPGPDYDGPLNEREGFTDMTIWGLVRETTQLSIRMNKDWADDGDWHKRYQILLDYENTVRSKYLAPCNPDIPLQAYCMYTGSAILANIFLVAFKPIEDHVGSRPKGSGQSILVASSNVLSKAINVPDTFKKWSWWAWIQWHALAVALSELCISPIGPLSEKAWPVVECAFQQYSTLIGDARAVIMWRPVEKLRQRAMRRRNEAQAAKNVRDQATDVAQVQQMFPSPMPSQGTPNTNQAQWDMANDQPLDFNLLSDPSLSTEQNPWMSQLFPDPYGSSRNPAGSVSPTTSPPDDNWMQFVSEYMDASNKDSLMTQGYDNNNTVVF